MLSYTIPVKQALVPNLEPLQEAISQVTPQIAPQISEITQKLEVAVRTHDFEEAGEMWAKMNEQLYTLPANTRDQIWTQAGYATLNRFGVNEQEIILQKYVPAPGEKIRTAEAIADESPTATHAEIHHIGLSALYFLKIDDYGAFSQQLHALNQIRLDHPDLVLAQLALSVLKTLLVTKNNEEELSLSQMSIAELFSRIEAICNQEIIDADALNTAITKIISEDGDNFDEGEAIKLFSHPRPIVRATLLCVMYSAIQEGQGDEAADEFAQDEWDNQEDFIKITLISDDISREETFELLVDFCKCGVDRAQILLDTLSQSDNPEIRQLAREYQQDLLSDE